MASEASLALPKERLANKDVSRPRDNVLQGLTTKHTSAREPHPQRFSRHREQRPLGPHS